VNLDMDPESSVSIPIFLLLFLQLDILKFSLLDIYHGP